MYSAAHVEAQRLADERRAVELEARILAALGKRAQDPRYAHDPAGWCRDVLGLDPWSRQCEIAEATDAHQIVMVPSGQKTGKSTIAMAIALWWVCTRKRGLVVCTSGNGQQVRSILWREMTKLVNGSRLDRALGATLNTLPSNGFNLPDGRQILGFTADEKEKMAGYSGDELLFIVDESSGIADDIWEAIRGNLMGGAHALCISNPTRTTGWFYERCTTMKDRQPVIRIDSRETPNYINDNAEFPGLATRAAVAELEAETGGEGNVVFDVRVRGLFPAQAANSVVSAAAVEIAIGRWAQAKPDWTYPIVVGVDVARFGDDDSVLQAVVGPYAFAPVVFHGLDTREVAGEARKYALSIAAQREAEMLAEGVRFDIESPYVHVDVNGVGAGVVDNIDRVGLNVRGIGASERATRDDKFINRRAELWLDIPEWLKVAAMPPCPRRDVELLAPTYSFGERNRLKVESKDDIKKKIKRSPDHADALALAVTRVVTSSGPVSRPAGREAAARGGWL